MNGGKMMMSLQEAAAMITNAKLVGNGAASFSRVHTDTRTLQAGDLFVALRGERFDAHEFLPQLKAKGCTAVIAEHGITSTGISGIEVPDSRKALGELAHGWRKRFMSVPLVAVTGSNGKTTVTQLIASIFAAWQGEDKRLATQGNFNNDVGLPLTLLRLRDSDKAAVVEIGMNHIGEVPYLGRIAAPTVAVVNNAQREHQEFMGTIEATARENGTVFESLVQDGIAVFPVGAEQHAYEHIWRSQSGAHRVLTFGQSQQADVMWQAQTQGAEQQLHLHTPWGQFETSLSLLGDHNAHNAAAAAAAAFAAGASADAVKQGLARFKAVKGRLVRNDYQIDSHHITLIDDTYNANPDSVLAAINVLAQLPSPRWLVLGDMGEVGDQGPEFHREVGAYAKQRGVNWFFGIGELMTHAINEFESRTHAVWFSSRESLSHAINQALASELPKSILIKGSRFMQMEEFVAAAKSAIEERGGVTC